MSPLLRLSHRVQMADSQSSPPPASRQNRGGRQRGRGSRRQLGSDEREHRTRGRGGGVRTQNRNADKPGAPTDGGGQAPSGPAVGEEKAKQIAVDTVEDADDGEICFICASRGEHTSISPCNHRTCHICALRLRALYKNRACAHCRVRCGPHRSWASANVCRLDRIKLCDLHRRSYEAF